MATQNEMVEQALREYLLSQGMNTADVDAWLAGTGVQNALNRATQLWDMAATTNQTMLSFSPEVIYKFVNDWTANMVNNQSTSEDTAVNNWLQSSNAQLKVTFSNGTFTPITYTGVGTVPGTPGATGGGTTDGGVGGLTGGEGGMGGTGDTGFGSTAEPWGSTGPAVSVTPPLNIWEEDNPYLSWLRGLQSGGIDMGTPAGQWAQNRYQGARANWEQQQQANTLLGAPIPRWGESMQNMWDVDPSLYGRATGSNMPAMQDWLGTGIGTEAGNPLYSMAVAAKTGSMYNPAYQWLGSRQNDLAGKWMAFNDPSAPGSQSQSWLNYIKNYMGI